MQAEIQMDLGPCSIKIGRHPRGLTAVQQNGTAHPNNMLYQIRIPLWVDRRCAVLGTGKAYTTSGDGGSSMGSMLTSVGAL